MNNYEQALKEHEQLINKIMNSEHPIDVKQRYVETATKAFVKSMESSGISMNKILKIGDE